MAHTQQLEAMQAALSSSDHGRSNREMDSAAATLEAWDLDYGQQRAMAAAGVLPNQARAAAALHLPTVLRGVAALLGRSMGVELTLEDPGPASELWDEGVLKLRLRLKE